ncbi:MAG: MptD family putative ECF transporter S component [Treponema sp.]|jgi:energy-coupling factor transport system substrate-specific component|nr:MptD family putative ECF transporter S component [Treponema sp.]
MDTKKLPAKDLITVGIFCAIYFVVMFIVVMTTGILPLLWLFEGAFIGIVCGTVYMLFLTRVRRFGMISLMGTLLGIVMVLMGSMWPVLVFAVLSALIADLITKQGNYTSLRAGLAGYCVFGIWPVGTALPLWLARDAYLEYTAAGYGADYAEGLASLTPLWILPLMLITAVVGSCIGGLIGKGILKKHFERNGIA